MWDRGIGLTFCGLLLFGCAALEEPRWAMLGDTDEKAFFMDRQEVRRLPDGNYHFPVKVYLYQDGQTHQRDDSRDTNQVLYVEMDCAKKRWTEAGRGVIDKDGKTVFRHLNPYPRSQAVEAGTIYAAAYAYLCNNESIEAVHNH